MLEVHYVPYDSLDTHNIYLSYGMSKYKNNLLGSFEN